MSYSTPGNIPENEPSTRKRKSNFDVPPPSAEDLTTDPAVAASKIAQAKAIAALLTAYPNTSSLASVTKFLPEGHVLTPPGIPPSCQRDEVHYARLERAREKNINYVKRKDFEKLQKQARGEYEEPDFFFPSSKAPKLPRGNSHLKSGLGSDYGHKHHSSTLQPQHQKTISNENTSIYVAGLSPDLTEKDLETLFSVNGKIKKIKIYTFPDGRKKGDALVSFAKVEAVALACLQYNNVDIGGGYTLQVTRASFKTSNEQRTQTAESRESDEGKNASVIAAGEEAFVGMMHPQEHQGGLGYQQSTAVAPSNTQQISFAVAGAAVGVTAGGGEKASSGVVLTEEQKDCESLPVESEAYDYPVALIENVYDGRHFSKLDTTFFAELEADMLEACCACGRVRRLITPEHPRLVGSVAVTFEDTVGAQECFVKLNRRWFDSRQLSVRLLQQPPRPPQQPTLMYIPPQTQSESCYTLQPQAPRHSAGVTSSTTNADDVAVSNFLASMQETYGNPGDEDPRGMHTSVKSKHARSSIYDDDEGNCGARDRGNRSHDDGGNGGSNVPDRAVDQFEAAAEAAQDTEDFLNSLL